MGNIYGLIRYFNFKRFWAPLGAAAILATATVAWAVAPTLVFELDGDVFVRVRRADLPEPISKTFESREEVENCARCIESEVDVSKGVLFPSNVDVKSMILRYTHPNVTEIAKKLG